jgi:aminopeptidase N
VLHAKDAVQSEAAAAAAPTADGPTLSCDQPLADATPATVNHVGSDIWLDPTTGAVTSTTSIRATAVQPNLKSVTLVVDMGLDVSAATVNGVPTTVFSQLVISPYRVLTFALPTPLTTGMTFELKASVAGSLACQRFGTGDDWVSKTSVCYLSNGNMGLFKEGSILPLLPVINQETRYPLTYDVTLHTPERAQVVATGDPGPSSLNGGWKTTTWRQARPVQPGFTIIAGTFAIDRFPGLGVDVALLHEVDENQWTAKLRAWLPRVLPFVEGFAGLHFPYGSAWLVKLSPRLGDPGYNAENGIFLSALHEGWGEALFEEAWAHELSHSLWGETTPPRDFYRQQTLNEGLAVLVEHDYAFAAHHAAEDRDEYLGRRGREAELMARYVLPRDKVPPLVVPTAAKASPVGDVPGFWLWAYQKPAVTWDFLRVALGDATFAAGLRDYTQRCQHHACSIGDFHRALERASGRNLAPYFEQFLCRSSYASLSVGFSQRPQGAGGSEVTVELAQTGELSLPVELWVELESGKRQKLKVQLDGRTARYTAKMPERVRAVRPNPRQEALLWSRSAVPGDVNYDGVRDAKDESQCRALLGKRVLAPFVARGEAISGIDLDFDPRCDRNGDGLIDEHDLSDL